MTDDRMLGQIVQQISTPAKLENLWLTMSQTCCCKKALNTETRSVHTETLQAGICAIRLTIFHIIISVCLLSYDFLSFSNSDQNQISDSFGPI